MIVNSGPTIKPSGDGSGRGDSPGPTLRRGRRAFWNPADVDLFRRQRLRRIGAEMGEAVGLATPTASGDSLAGISTERTNNNGS